MGFGCGATLLDRTIYGPARGRHSSTRRAPQQILVVSRQRARNGTVPRPALERLQSAPHMCGTRIEKVDFKWLFLRTSNPERNGFPHDMPICLAVLVPVDADENLL